MTGSRATLRLGIFDKGRLKLAEAGQIPTCLGRVPKTKSHQKEPPHHVCEKKQQQQQKHTRTFPGRGGGFNWPLEFCAWSQRAKGSTDQFRVRAARLTLSCPQRIDLTSWSSHVGPY